MRVNSGTVVAEKKEARQRRTVYGAIHGPTMKKTSNNNPQNSRHFSSPRSALAASQPDGPSPCLQSNSGPNVHERDRTEEHSSSAGVWIPRNRSDTNLHWHKKSASTINPPLDDNKVRPALTTPTAANPPVSQPVKRSGCAGRGGQENRGVVGNHDLRHVRLDGLIQCGSP